MAVRASFFRPIARSLHSCLPQHFRAGYATPRNHDHDACQAYLLWIIRLLLSIRGFGRRTGKGGGA